MNKNLRRSVVALAATLASLAFLATPASAVVYTSTVTGGTITVVNGTTTFTGTLGGTVGTGCGTTMEITAVHPATGVTGTANITAFTSIFHFIFAGSHWIAELTRLGSASGSAASGAIGSPTPPTLTLRLDIYEQSGNDSTGTNCTNRSTRRCTLRANNLSITGTYSSVMGSTSMTSSSTYSITGSGNLTAFVGQTCAPPFNAFISSGIVITPSGAT